MNAGSEHCECTCGKPGCASRPGRINRAGLTVHGTPDGYNRGCRCDECRAAASVKKSARFARRNAKTREQATNHGGRWTEAELVTAARADLTDYEAAQLLGRTMQAVKRARQRHGTC